MRNLSKEFENKNIVYEKLLEYGFKKKDEAYYFETLIYNARFKICIEISKKEKNSKVVDTQTGEEYVLVDVKNSSGEFVGRVRDEYENILNEIIKTCTTPNIFKSKQASQVIKYIQDKYQDDLEYLWTKFPNNAVWRNKTNNKWYGALLTIPESKLKIDFDKIIEIIDLRYPKDKIKDAIDNQQIFAGYHMNKDNWITVRLDGSMEIKEIYKLIDVSYALSLDK